MGSLSLNFKALTHLDMAGSGQRHRLRMRSTQHPVHFRPGPVQHNPSYLQLNQYIHVPYGMWRPSCQLNQLFAFDNSSFFSRPRHLWFLASLLFRQPQLSPSSSPSSSSTLFFVNPLLRQPSSSSTVISSTFQSPTSRSIGQRLPTFDVHQRFPFYHHLPSFDIQRRSSVLQIGVHSPWSPSSSSCLFCEVSASSIFSCFKQIGTLLHLSMSSVVSNSTFGAS
ncbi:hypothetical protein GE09DRAFT_637937 [Coniochaeta sp. 2T2.1]|nr:hypothetical protein GE09DRAFT_637937 [Coniochaeta sp. 2T2.1]